MLLASARVHWSKCSRSAPPSATTKTMYSWLSGKASRGSFSDTCLRSQASHSRTRSFAYFPLQTPTPCVSTKAEVAFWQEVTFRPGPTHANNVRVVFELQDLRPKLLDQRRSCIYARIAGSDVEVSNLSVPLTLHRCFPCLPLFLARFPTPRSSGGSAHDIFKKSSWVRLHYFPSPTPGFPLDASSFIHDITFMHTPAEAYRQKEHFAGMHCSDGNYDSRGTRGLLH